MAINAQLAHPIALCVDSSGNLYIADYINNVIRLVTTAGIISTYAGGCTVYCGGNSFTSSGYSGDNVPATTAMFWNPTGVAVDASGRLYIADHSNNRIRIVSNTGIITTYIGVGGNSPQSQGDGGVATSAQLQQPTALTLDASGNLYIVESYQIRLVTNTGIVSVYAGGQWVSGYNGDNIPATSAYVTYANGICLDASGNLYVADTYNKRIRIIHTMLACPPGDYDASGICWPCPLGTYQGSNLYQGTNLVTTYCSFCPVNTYSSTLAATVCTACPTGTNNAILGATSATACNMVS